jgi:hypothetical protein
MKISKIVMSLFQHEILTTRTHTIPPNAILSYFLQRYMYRFENITIKGSP